MNKKSIDKLWLIAYKLHGTLDMPELCRLMIYAMFIKHVDLKKSMDESVELPSYDEKYSVSYLALTYGRMVSTEQLVKYMQGLEGDFMIKDGIVSAELKGLLVKSDNQDVQMIFTAIDETGFQDSRQLYETASLLLDKLSYQHGNLRNDTSSNLSLCRLEGRLLDCQEGMTVYDGFCGNGLSANESTDGGCIIYLQDMDKSAASVACVMSLLKGNRIGAVKCGDSLADPMSPEKYDRIVCEPPFVTRYNDGYCSSIPDGNILYPEISDDASIALRHALAHLKDDGIAIVIVPMGILLNYKSAGIREKLIETYLDAVIELPAGASPNAGTATALLALKKDINRKSVYMVNAKEFFEKGGKNQLVISDENINRIADMYKKREKSEGISIDLHKGKFDKSKRNLSASQYVVSDPKNAIIVGDASACLKEYHQLTGQLAEVDGRLEAIRSRFVINAAK